MGGNQSSLAGIEGFQIVRVMPSSPAHVAGLVPFFDFILSVDTLNLSVDNNRVFKDYIVRNKNNVISLTVFNTKIRMVREITLTPSDTWGGIGLLGCSINWESVEKAIECSWHIVDVIPNGCAHNAGIVAQRDYIVGMQCLHGEDRGLITMLSNPGDFHARLEQWSSERMNTPPKVGAVEGLLLLIFDNVENSLKEVLVPVPRGSPLGIDVASGYLHAIPHNTGDTRIPFIKAFHVPSSVPNTTTEVSTLQVPPPPPPPAIYQQPQSIPQPPPPYVATTQQPPPSPVLQQQQQQQQQHPLYTQVPVPPPAPTHTEPHPYQQPAPVIPQPSLPPPPQWGAPYQPPFAFPTLPPMPQPLKQ